MQACEERQGQVWGREAVREQGLPIGKFPCVCVYLNKRWRWRRLSDLSHKSFKENRPQIAEWVSGLTANAELDPRHAPIRITGAIGSNAANLNGLWQPRNEERRGAAEFQVYVNINGPSPALWLYQDRERGQWWIGILGKMKRRSPWGFARDSRYLPPSQAGPLPRPCRPWEVTAWKVWGSLTDPSGAEGQEQWHDCETLEVVSALPESNKDRLHREQIVALEERSTADLDAARIRSATFQYDAKTYWNLLTFEARRELLGIEMGEAPPPGHCQICLRRKPIGKCVHFDCSGACDDCRDASLLETGTCCACGQEQRLECPICLESKTPDHMNIFACKHAVCWQCNCKAHEAKRPLTKCPVCRGKL